MSASHRRIYASRRFNFNLNPSFHDTGHRAARLQTNGVYLLCNKSVASPAKPIGPRVRASQRTSSPSPRSIESPSHKLSQKPPPVGGTGRATPGLGSPAVSRRRPSPRPIIHKRRWGGEEYHTRSSSSPKRSRPSHTATSPTRPSSPVSPSEGGGSSQDPYSPSDSPPGDDDDLGEASPQASASDGEGPAFNYDAWGPFCKSAGFP